MKGYHIVPFIHADGRKLYEIQSWKNGDHVSSHETLELARETVRKLLGLNEFPKEDNARKTFQRIQ